MTRCRTLIFGLLLIVVQSAIGQNFKTNPFLSNGYANDVNAFITDQERTNQIDMNSNVFLSHAISNRAAGFSGPQYLPPKEKQQLICSGQDVCVRKNNCNNGYFTQKQQSGSRQDCDYDSEICCLYKPPPPPPTPVPSTPCTGNNYACVAPNVCQNGEIKTSNFLKSASSGKCYAPEVCCRIPEPESTVLDENGYHIKVPNNPLVVPTQKPYQPQQPYQPTQKPYQQTPKPYQPTPGPYEPTQKPYQPQPQPQQPYPGTQKPYQQTPKPYQPQPQPQQPYRPTQTPYEPQPQPQQPQPATQKPYQPQPQPQQPYRPTQKPYQPQPQPQQPYQPQPYQPTQKPYQPQPQPQQPYQPTQKPYQPQPQPQQPYQPTQKPYQPQPQPQQPYQPQPQPQQPYQPQPQPQQPYQPQPQPQQPYKPTQKPYQPQPQPQQPYQPPTGTRFPVTSAPQYLPPSKQPYQPKPTPPRRGEDQLSLPIPKPERPRPPIISNDILSEPQLPQTCAAALNCTRTEYCSATGVIQETPVVLTPEQELFRVPMTKCQDQIQGFVGVCCRDSNYVDPWPVSQLGQYNAKDFGDDGTYKPNPGISRPQRRVATANSVKVNRKSSVETTKVSRQAQTAQCVSRNLNSVLKGIAAIDADFGEYPWQTMILLESTKSLLCGGIIVADDVVVTAAHCVSGRKPFDVLIKAGEWKLGRDEEPLTFQISRAKKIEIHPQYNPSGLQYDIAILHLDSKLIFDIHIGPICIDDTEPTSSEQCVTTGWGKEVLRVHAQDAIMHHSPVTCGLSRDECGADESKICGKPDIDGCELDPGSALACRNSKGQYVLKGVYSSEDKCGDSIISFTKPDLIWINSAIYNTGKQSKISVNSF